MMLHFEERGCESELNGDDIYEWADQCTAAINFLTYGRERLAYKCAVCKKGFRELSGVYQHVESLSCDTKAHESDLERLANQLRGRIDAYQKDYTYMSDSSSMGSDTQESLWPWIALN